MTEALDKVRRAMPALPKGCGIDDVLVSLGQSYKRGRRLLRRAYADPGEETFHDLRKLVQLHWRHCQIVSRAWPEELELRVAAAREISAILGEENDLADLCAWLRTGHGGDLPSAAAEQIMTAAHRLRLEAREIGRAHV